ncbi:dynactin subunit 6-like [Homarus americanus]|uniref:dynactin subunit 6-like n=1 Tax=Homarus americanus TaxID=6706 RepID=UPI001C470E1F|nr:dynactin subunit 6-like [Homarus americanus]XP_042225220.1 dynactin subunit 6-like [Homarus americanus]XP_042225221.1 dynactin subunit 6-like [Homarus americanus]
MSLVKQLDPAICNVKVTPGAVVCFEADYYGDITIGARTVIHPKARIIAESGPIIIGEGNLIEEQAQIINKLPEGVEAGDEPPVMVIGNNNVFEVDSYCQASKMGDNNVLEAKSHIGPGVELSRGCVVGSLCSMVCPQVVQENTVIYGDELHHRTQSEKPAPQGLQLDFLTKILPNYHHLIKPKKKAVESQHQ